MDYTHYSLLYIMSECHHCNKQELLYVGYDLCIPCILYLDINHLGIEKYKNNDTRYSERKWKK